MYIRVRVQKDCFHSYLFRTLLFCFTNDLVRFICLLEVMDATSIYDVARNKIIVKYMRC